MVGRWDCGHNQGPVGMGTGLRVRLVAADFASRGVVSWASVKVASTPQHHPRLRSMPQPLLSATSRSASIALS